MLHPGSVRKKKEAISKIEREMRVLAMRSLRDFPGKDPDPDKIEI